MKTLSILLILFLSPLNDKMPYSAEIIKFQKELNEHYKDKDDSPLTKKDRKQFDGHPFFPIDESYRVTAFFERTAEEEPFKMKTSTERLPEYVQYGIAYFTLKGKTHTLRLLQNVKFSQQADYEGELFLPFNDLTNGKQTYGGGRYIDLKIPEGDQIVIDFNKSYHPYCAYNYIYSCPLPPAENSMEIEVLAGIKMLQM
ncbi:MAG: DUF1684 domain-containing protein [Chitinophagales bacterium]|nr:DUF1684 domain-containing protein [Chitinophagales bacterium]